jgi:hypothetical protein
MIAPLSLDFSLVFGELLPLLPLNESGQHVSAGVPRTFDFCSEPEFVHWCSVFVGRFAAFSAVKAILDVHEHPFDVWVDFGRALLGASRFADVSGNRQSRYWTKFREVMPGVIHDNVMNRAFVGAAKCFDRNRDDVELCLRTLAEGAEVRQPLEVCVRELEKFTESAVVAELLANSEVPEYDFSWY